MIKKVTGWLKGLKKDRNLKVTIKGQNTKVYLNDPTTSDLIIEETNPTNTVLPMRSIGEMGDGYPLGSLQQQAMAVKIIVNDALKYMTERCPKKITNWAAVQSLTLMPRAGKDINAYYDRNALRFFFFGDKKMGKNIFACDARPVVSHEFGHAFLDILRPDWWDMQSVEVWAFHEAFGDMTAILNSLQYDALIDSAIKETNSDLMKSSVLSRLAAEMGTGLYNLTEGQDGELNNCLRDTTVVYKYVNPESLPSEGRDDQLLSEPHSFSRVFVGAFWEILVKISQDKKSKGMSYRDAIKQTRDVLTKYLLTSIINVPNTPRLFDAIAKQMIALDQSNGGNYKSILQEVFLNRGILIQKVMMLEDKSLETVLGEIKDKHLIQNFGEFTFVRTFKTKTMKLTKKTGLISALDNNPLLDLEIVVPYESSYCFQNNKLVDMNIVDEDEVIQTASKCLNMLHNKDLVGNNPNSLFENKDGKLVRKQIVCTCGKPNYCDPNAPEYGKPWKPANNSGCVSCHNKKCKPESCSCEQKNEEIPIKTGCFTQTKIGNQTVYKYGNTISRKVC